MRRILSAVLACLAMAIFGMSSAWADDGDPSFGGSYGGSDVHVGGQTDTNGHTSAATGASDGPATRTLTCNLSGAVSAACQGAADACLRPPLAPPTNAVVTQEQQPDGSWRQTGVDCDGDGANDALAVTAAMVRQEVVRLLPPVAVGVAPANGPTLVNFETIFWSPTPAQRELGPVTILGQRVAITIRFDHATYDYGDGTTETVDGPGAAWTPEVCSTAQCPTLQGHTYTEPAASVTARSTVTWTATFTVGNGAAQPIPGTVDGPTSAHTLQVLEGRSVIVR